MSEVMDRMICGRCEADDETSLVVGIGYSRRGIESIMSRCSLCGQDEVSDPGIWMEAFAEGQYTRFAIAPEAGDLPDDMFYITEGDDADFLRVCELYGEDSDEAANVLEVHGPFRSFADAIEEAVWLRPELEAELRRADPPESQASFSSEPAMILHINRL